MIQATRLLAVCVPLLPATGAFADRETIYRRHTEIYASVLEAAGRCAKSAARGG